MEGRKFKMGDLWGIFKESFKEWNDDDAFTQAAAVSYYAIFSIPAILIIVINIVGAVFGKQAAEGQIEDTIAKAVSPDAAAQIQTMIANSSQNSNTTIMAIIGIATLVIGATGLFIQLQKALNRIWDVKANPDAGMGKMALDRTRSLGIILVVGFLLLITLVITTALSVLTNYLMARLPEVTIYVFYALNFLVSIGIITVLFALIYKYLPDVKIEFQSVWVGAFVTAILFMIGKFGISFYMGQSDPGSAYGAAGSIILILLWIYYSCLIMFLGAEFTQVYARKYGHPLQPSKHAIKVDPCIPAGEGSYGHG